MESVIKAYLQALHNGHHQEILALFAPNAEVVSPLYGTRPAKVFYKELLDDTNTSRIELLDIFINDKKQTAAVNFLYHWTLADGTPVSFDCVDVIEFDDQNKITHLKIIYDTVQTRNALEQQKRSTNS